MMKIAPPLLLGLLVTGCAAPKAEPPPKHYEGRYGRQLHELRTANISRDVDAAIARGDTQPMGINGIVPIVPGFDDPAVLQEFGTASFIPNTTDSIVNAQHMDLQIAAYDYADCYNRILQQKLHRTATRPGK